MIIDHLYLMGAIAPAEHDSPLAVNSDRMKAGQISFEHLQSIARRNFEIVKPYGGVEVLQLSLGHVTQFARESSGCAGLAIQEQVFGQAFPETDDHVITLSNFDNMSIKLLFEAADLPHGVPLILQVHDFHPPVDEFLQLVVAEHFVLRDA